MAYLALVTPPLVLSSTYTQQKTTPYVAYEQTHTYTHIYTHIYNIHVDMTRYSKSL